MNDRARRMRGWGAGVLLLVLGCTPPPARAPLAIGPGGCSSSTAPAVWRIQPDGVLRGQVASTLDTPLQQALVTIRAVGGDAAPERQAHAGDGGGFRFENQAPGRYWVRVRHVAHGMYSDTVDFVPEPGEEPRVTLCYYALS